MLYLPFAVWSVAWLILLVDCVRRREFPGTLGAGHAGRVVWLLTFVLLDPLLTALYLVFVVLRLGRGANWTTAITILAVALSIAGWVDGLGSTRTDSLTRQEDGNWSDVGSTSWFEAGIQFSETATGFDVMTGGRGGAAAPPRHVQILLDGSGAELRGAAGLLANQLQRVRSIERIEFLPIGTVAVGSRAPDLRLYLTRRESGLPAIFRHSPCSLAPIEQEIRIGMTRWTSSGIVGSVEPGPMIRPRHDIRASGIWVWYGFVFPSRRVGASGSIEQWSQELVRSIRSELATSAPVDVPEAFYGSWREPMELPFLERVDARRLLAESDALVHSKVVWRFTMPGRSELERIREELRAAGFESAISGHGSENPEVQMRNGSHWISIAASQERPSPTYWRRDDGTSGVDRPRIAGLSFDAQYRYRFDDADLEKVTNAVLEHGNPGLLVAWAQECNAEVRRTIHDRLRDAPVGHPFETLARARLADRVGDTESVAAWARRASVYAKLGYEPLADDTLFRDRLGRILEGIEGASLTDPDRADYVAAGFHFLDEGQASIRSGTYGVLAVAVTAADGSPVTACVRVRPNDQDQLELWVEGAASAKSPPGAPGGIDDELSLQFDLDGRTVEAAARPLRGGFVELTGRLPQ